MMTPKVFTVSQLNARVSALITSDPELQTVFIEGELSNVHMNLKSGHLYFSLKDKDSVIRAVMFSWAVRGLRFTPEDGMKVIMRAQVTVYEAGGQYQLRVEDMQPDGVGALAMQLEQLKKKLGAQGLFDPEHKKPIPAIPETIGVITSPTGAALRDIMDIIGRRFPSVEIILAPVLVQGEGAPEQLIRAVKLFSEYYAADVLIIGRGGGSMEDLWAFNDEELARAIYDCPIPVISAVGHETDTTICDFVSDLRAPTPSAAAELAVPNRVDLYANVISLYRRGITAFNTKNDQLNQQIDQLSRLISAHSPMPVVENRLQMLDQLLARSQKATESSLQRATAHSQELFVKVEALNPVAVLNRGFASVKRGEEYIDSAHSLNKGDMIDITFKDGKVKAEIQ